MLKTGTIILDQLDPAESPAPARFHHSSTPMRQCRLRSELQNVKNVVGPRSMETYMETYGNPFTGKHSLTDLLDDLPTMCMVIWRSCLKVPKGNFKLVYELGSRMGL